MKYKHSMRHFLHRTLAVISAALMFSITLIVDSAAQNTPYPVQWINVTGANSTGTTLVKTIRIATWTNSGAVSSNFLSSDADGWLEFTASIGHYMIGFASENSFNHTAFAHAFMINYPSNTYTIYEGGTAIASGARQPSDVFRISRNQNVISYVINGDTVRSVNIAAGFWRVKTCLKDQGTTTPPVFASFDAELIVQGNITATDTEQGSVALTVTGGKPPYSYSWSTGESVSNIIGKQHGTYSCLVTDAVGRTKEADYTIGYKVNWINGIGVSVNGSRLTKTQQHYTWVAAGAYSSNILPANTDGFVEFSTESTGGIILGYASNNVIDLTTFTNAFKIDYFTNSYVIHEGTNTPTSGGFQIGDLFRIARQGNIMRYFKNGALLRSVTVDPNLVLRIKTSIQRPGITTPTITSSFDGEIVLQAYPLGVPGNFGQGSLSTSTSGGAPPYSFVWASGETNNALTGLQKGVYSVTVTDAVGRTLEKTYNLGYRVSWATLSNVIVSGMVLKKTQAHYTWTHAGAVSSNILRAGKEGWIEFVAGPEMDLILGLSSNSTLDLTQFTYGIRINTYDNVYTIHEGNQAVKTGSLELGDVFKISRVQGSIIYTRNKETIRSISATSTVDLKIKTAIRTPYSYTPYINSSFLWNNDISRTYYAIANGNWASPDIWSTQRNGAPSTIYPDEIDKVIIDGYDVVVSSNVSIAGIELVGNKEQTSLKVEGNTGRLVVRGTIEMSRGDGGNSGEMLSVQSAGRLEVEAP